MQLVHAFLRYNMFSKKMYPLQESLELVVVGRVANLHNKVGGKMGQETHQQDYQTILLDLSHWRLLEGTTALQLLLHLKKASLCVSSLAYKAAN